MKSSINFILLTTTFILLASTACVKIQPQSLALQGRRMEGQHTWHGTENDHILPSYPDYRPAYDTSYNVTLGFAFYSQDEDINLYIYQDTISGHFMARGFHCVAANETLKTLTYTNAYDNYGISETDTLLYNYGSNTINIRQHYTDTRGTYLVNINTP